jgi:predicted kinase
LNVIVDAAFLEAADREVFRTLARRMGAAFVIVSCQADPISLAAHVLERTARHDDPSDATVAVLDKQLRELQPLEASEQRFVVPIEVTKPDAVQIVADAIRARSASPQVGSG